MPLRMDNTEFRAQNRTHAANTRSALSSGFLNGVGSNKSYGQAPIVFDELEAVLLKYAELFVKGFSEELDKNDSNASGALDSSIRFEYSKKGKVYEAVIYMTDYAKFVDEGVQGVDASKSINRTSPYRFKFIHPTASHVAALEKWIREKNVTAMITVPKGIVSKTLKSKSLAYAIGTATKARGLRATFFKKRTEDKLIGNFKAEISAALKQDIKITITQ